MLHDYKVLDLFLPNSTFKLKSKEEINKSALKHDRLCYIGLPALSLLGIHQNNYELVMLSNKGEYDFK